MMSMDASTSSSLSSTELEQATTSIQELLKAYVAFFGNVPAEHGLYHYLIRFQKIRFI
jgi:hypothetical protein